MKKITVIFTIGFIVFLYLIFLFFRASDNPDFCKNCHFMKPYYENWAGSSHNTVPCYKCHYGPELKDYIGGKFRLLGEMLRYFAGVYHREIRTKVKDEVCYSCHKKEEFVDKKLSFTEKKINFTHSSHLDGKIRELEFKCQNCHSELVQGKHTAVSVKVCLLCHFMGGRVESKGKCGICHGPPKEKLLLWGVPFEHSQYIKAGISCNTCHLNVTQGRGDVKSEKCEECHVEIRKEMFDYRKVHKVHVNLNNISCFRCHEEIKHGKIQIFQVFSPLCQECHGNTHFVQEKVYSGTGGIGTPNLPDRMFIAGVVCQGCHQIKVKRTSLGPHFELPKAEPSSCIFCHGRNFDKLLIKWQKLIKERLNKVKKFEELYNLFKDFKILNFDKKKVDINIQLIESDKSFGAHNIRYINLLLDAVEKELNLEIKKPSIEKIYAENSNCIECHFGIENKNSEFNGRNFLHGPHLFRYRCLTCHIEADPQKGIHGNLKKISRNCDSCHHKDVSENCGSCHKMQEKFYSGKILSDSPDFMREAEVSCSDCHMEDKRIVRPDPSVCSNCHEEEYEKDFREKINSLKKKMEEFEANIPRIARRLRKEGDRKKVMEFYKLIREYREFRKEGSNGAHNLMYMEEFIDKLKNY